MAFYNKTDTLPGDPLYRAMLLQLRRVHSMTAWSLR